LEGSPGSGKTTLIQMMLRQLGVQDPVTSPTFALVQLYRNEAGQRFAHLDLYRIKSAAEAEEAGLNEILQEPYDKIFVEWPSRVPEFFENLNAVIIVFESDGERRTFKVKRRKIL
jgi:tRNA threonylcarbamoyladenosine biosynthesis protein TsaE